MCERPLSFLKKIPMVCVCRDEDTVIYRAGLIMLSILCFDIWQNNLTRLDHMLLAVDPRLQPGLDSWSSCRCGGAAAGGAAELANS